MLRSRRTFPIEKLCKMYQMSSWLFIFHTILNGQMTFTSLSWSQREITERNNDSSGSFDMIPFECLVIQWFNFEMIGISEHQHWHFHNHSCVMWEYPWAIWLKYLHYCLTNSSTEPDGDDEYSFAWWCEKCRLFTTHCFHVDKIDESNLQKTLEMIIN
jgi:hypothetical protein